VGCGQNVEIWEKEDEDLDNAVRARLKERRERKRKSKKDKKERKRQERKERKEEGEKEGKDRRKGRKENLHPLLDAEGNAVSQDQGQAEVLSAFFASVFPSKAGCSLGTQPLVLVGRDGEQNRRNPR